MKQKWYRQRAIKGGRDTVAVYLDPRVYAALRADADRYGVSASFAADVALADQLGVDLDAADRHDTRRRSARLHRA